MFKRQVQFFLVFCPFLLQAQPDCLRSESTFVGEIVTHEYNTAYYTDLDTFDFPVKKVWRTQRSNRVWTIPGELTDEKIVMQADRTLAPPDTFRFERFIKSTGKRSVFQLTRFFGDIYQVWKISFTSYAWPRQHTTLIIPVEIRTFEQIYTDWPDDFMKDGAYKTDPKKVLAKIEKYRCKDFDAGRRKAGAN